MTDERERDELSEDEFEDESAEALPDREAMSILTYPGDSLGPPPLDDSPPQPTYGDEEP